jgi:putative oxidoreductase
MKKFAPLIGRILLALIFLMSGISKIGDFAGTQAYMESYGMPATAVFLVGAIVFEVAGALMIMLGYYARVGAIALIVFLIPATLIFHMDFGERTQMIMFMKNLSIMGGLLFVAAYGPGSYSLKSS